MPTLRLMDVGVSEIGGWPDSVTYILLIALGYALTRVVDLIFYWLRDRLPAGHRGANAATDSSLTATARQHLMERHRVADRFRKSVTDAVEAAVNQGHGTYGMLYQIRDDYGDLLRHSPIAMTQAADSVIRCVTLLVNLGPSDQRYAMFTRALKHFDEECGTEASDASVAGAPRRQEFSSADEPTVPIFDEDLRSDDEGRQSTVR